MRPTFTKITYYVNRKFFFYFLKYSLLTALIVKDNYKARAGTSTIKIIVMTANIL